MPAWIPKITKFDEDLAEEEQRVAVLKERALWRPAPMPEPPAEPTTIIEEPQTPSWQPEIQPDIQPRVEPDYEAIDRFVQPDFRLSDLEDSFTPSRQWQPSQTMAQVQTQQPSEVTPPQKQTATWEQPAVWGASLERGAGEVINKVPLLPDILKFVAPAFEWIKENLETTLAAALTYPFQPVITPLAGESGYDTFKRQYQEWNAPTYVKGLAEAPLWFIPFVGWAGKGAKALGASSRAVRIGTGIAEWTFFPPAKLLDEALFKPNNWKNLAQVTRKVPVLNKAVEYMGGLSVFTTNAQNDVLQATRRAILKFKHLSVIGEEGKVPQLTALLTQHKDYNKVAGIQNGIVTTAIPKPGVIEPLKRGITDVLENLDKFDFTTPQAKQVMEDTLRAIKLSREAVATEGGLKINDIIGRVVEGKELSEKAIIAMAEKETLRTGKTVTPEEMRTRLGDDIIDLSKGTRHDLHQHDLPMEDQINRGVRYSSDLADYIKHNVTYDYRRVGWNRLSNELKQYGKTPDEFWAAANPEQQAVIAKYIRGGRVSVKFSPEFYARGAINTLITRKGATLPGSVFRKIRTELPDMSPRIDDIVRLRPESTEAVIAAFSREIKQNIRLSQQEYKTKIKTRLQQSNAETLRTISVFTPTEIESAFNSMGDIGKYVLGTPLTSKGEEFGAKFRIALENLRKSGETAFDASGKVTNVELKKVLHSMGMRGQDTNALLNRAYQQVLKTRESGTREMMGELNKATIELRRFIRDKQNATMADVELFLKDMKLGEDTINKITEAGYIATQRANRQGFDSLLRNLRDDLDTSLQGIKDTIKGPAAERAAWLQKVRENPHNILGEAKAIPTRVPAFHNQIFDTEVSNLIEKHLAYEGNNWVSTTAGLSGKMRSAIATFDDSSPFIQGMVLFGRNPALWAKTVLQHYDYWLHPENASRILVQKESIINDAVAHGINLARLEQVSDIGSLTYAIGKIPGIGKPIASAYKRAEAAFTGYGNLSRIELWEALKRPGMNPVELMDLGRSINRMTGVMSLSAIGIPKKQVDFENAFLFFAPRYTRASLALVGDTLRGGLTGAEARKALGGLAAAGTTFYIGAAKALGQQPNLDPTSGRFMTIKVGDSHVGIGGALYSLTRLGANVTATLLEDKGKSRSDLITPFSAGKINRDNPFISYMLGKTSPVTGTIANVIEQKNFIGEPFESPADWGKYMAEKVIPISMASVVTKGGVQPAVLAVSFAGGRTFPQSAWELQNDVRDKIALQQYGKTYDGITELDKRRIDSLPELQSLQQEADKQTELRGGLGLGFLQRKREHEVARKQYIDALTQAQTGVERGELSGIDFRLNMQKAGYALGQMYKLIDKRPEYKEVMEKLRNGTANKVEIQDQAYNELVNASYSDKYTNPETGIFDYSGYSEFTDGIRKTYGEEVWQYIQEREQQHRADLPLLAQEYYKAKDILKPYWGVQDKVTELFGERYANSSSGQTFIQKQRKRLRLTNPTIAQAYQMFYARPA